MNTIQTHFWAVRDYLAPVLRESKFKEHGRVTPEEFVAAGDFLAYKFPTWSWSAASSSDSKYTRDFLPRDKQYLISRGVPCLRRVSQMERAALGGKKSGEAAEADIPDERLLNFGEGNHGEEVRGKGGEDDWLATHLNDDTISSNPEEIADIPDSEPPVSSMTPGEEDALAAQVAGVNLGQARGDVFAHAGEEQNAIGDIPDMDDEDDLGDLGGGVEEVDDPALAKNTGVYSAGQTNVPASKLVSVRTYDCLITYDKYYQTPRMWLVGYSENGQPLKPTDIFDDVSSDYAQKTVTVEPFPHGNLSTASIHPCKHASVMKKVIERMNTSVIEQQRKARSGGSSHGNVESKKKRGWGLSAMKKGSTKDTESIPTPGGVSQGQEDSENDEIEGLRVDQYLLIFLKFMASIVPAIEIDATQAV